MADTYVQVTNPGQTVFNLPFSSNYLLKSHVKVYKGRNLLAETQTSTLVEGTDYTFTSATQITLTTGLASGEELTIQRQTQKDAQLSPWNDGSNLTAEALNNADLQLIYIVQEQSELNALSGSNSLTAINAVQNNLLTTGGTMSGELAMGSNKITGLGDPVSAQDAATKSYVGTALKTDIAADVGVTITDDSPNAGQIKIGLDADIATLRDMQAGAADQLKDLTSGELAILDGKSFRNSDSGAVLDTTSDTEIPSSKVIAAHVASSQLAIGGFIAIANETSFPDDMPERGVVVSINDAQGIIVNSSGVADQGTTAGEGENTSETVTITGFPDSLKGETLAASTGLIVTSNWDGVENSSTTNEYTYHKLLATEADVKQLSDTINDFHSRFRIASADPSSDNDDGDLYWNTATNTMRVYEAANNAGWRDLVTAGETTINGISAANLNGNTVPGGNTSGVFDGINNNETVTGSYRFRLNNVPSNAKASQFLVSIDGAIQEPNNGTYGTGESGVDNQPPNGFSITGNDIIFASPPLTNSPYFIITLGSALTIGAPSDNTVTSAKIVDGSITEPKLAVTGTPTTSDDNKVLKYRNNGIDPSYMEWGDPHPEGTVVKSTTNSNEDDTKFLRADGDGTCSWQHPLPVITATANGAIAANKPVSINTDGTVSEIAVTTDALGSEVVVGDQDDSQIKIVHDPDSDRVVIFYRQDADGSDPDAKIVYKVGEVIPSTNSMTFGTERTVVANDSSRGFNICYSTVHNKFVIAYIKGDSGETEQNNIYFRAGSMATGNDEINWGTEVAAVSAANGSVDGIGTGVAIKIGLAADDDNGTIACMYRKDVTIGSATRNRIYVTGLLTSSSNNNLTLNTASSSNSYLYFGINNNDAFDEWHGSNIGGLVYDGHNNKYIALVNQWNTTTFGADGKAYVFDFDIESDGEVENTNYLASNNMVGETAITTSKVNVAPNLSYDPVSQVFLATYHRTDNRVYATAFTYDGSSFTVGTEYQSTSTNVAASNGGFSQSLYFDDYNSEFGYSYIIDNSGNSANNHQRLVRFKVTSGTTTVTEAHADEQLGADVSWNSYPDTIYDPTNNRVIWAKPQSGEVKVQVLRPEYNALAQITTNNYLGFSIEAISDTATGRIAVVGNTTTQSGLTPGRKYYIDSDGTLSLTAGSPEVFAGIALSSTKLLIK